MSTPLAKLQALRRQAGSTGTVGSEVTAQRAASDLRMALRRAVTLRHQSTTAQRGNDRQLLGQEIAPGLHLFERTVALPFELPLQFCGAFDRGDSVAAGDVLFFDTETTGLTGGTGTRAFMVGTAQYVDGNAVHVRQLLISNMTAERAMLETFGRWVTPSTVFCSYNGKSYDAPLLRTRFRLARLGDPFAQRRHVDLLYPSRRQYKGSFENCRLQTIERNALRIVREDDLPGSEAPAAWLNYLRGGDAVNLRRVGEHNLQDVVTLAQLLPHLSFLRSAAAPILLEPIA